MGEVCVAFAAGANVDAIDHRMGLAALHIAVGTNNIALCRYLVEHAHARFFADGFGRMPTVVALDYGVDDCMTDYFCEMEVKGTGPRCK